MPFETTGLVMNKFSEGDPGKHALEVKNNTDAATIQVYNSEPTESRLYLTHMVAGPAPQHKYPESIVNISSSPGEGIKMTGTAESRFEYSVHVLTTDFVGLLPGNQTTEVSIRAIPDPDKSDPVRVVGVIITPQTDVMLQSVSNIED